MVDPPHTPDPVRLTLLSDAEFRAWGAALTPAQRHAAQVQTDTLTRALVDVIATHSAQYPELPFQVWLAAVAAVFTALSRLISGDES